MPFNNNTYQVQWAKLVRLMNIVKLRKQSLLSFMYAYITPLSLLYNNFLLFKEAVFYRLSISPQVVLLKRALNDRYDTQLRRIYLIDATEFNALPLYVKLENKRIVLPEKSEGHLVLYTKGETSIYTVDFIVKVPATIKFTVIEMRAFIDRYKLLSKTYQIQIF